MTDNQKEIIIQKIAWILGESETRIKWDMSIEQQIIGLVHAYEKMAEEKEVILYER